MVHWEARVTPFIYQPSSFASNFVPTVETTRMTYLLELLISRNQNVMLVGNTGKILLILGLAQMVLRAVGAVPKSLFCLESCAALSLPNSRMGRTKTEIVRKHKTQCFLCMCHALLDLRPWPLGALS